MVLIHLPVLRRTIQSEKSAVSGHFSSLTHSITHDTAAKSHIIRLVVQYRIGTFSEPASTCAQLLLWGTVSPPAKGLIRRIDKKYDRCMDQRSDK